MELSRQSDKVLCCIYRTFLQRCKAGESRYQAVMFEPDFYLGDKNLSKMIPDDVEFAIEELDSKNIVCSDITGGFTLNKQGIIYMENRFKNGLHEVIDFIEMFLQHI